MAAYSCRAKYSLIPAWTDIIHRARFSFDRESTQREFFIHFWFLLIIIRVLRLRLWSTDKNAAVDDLAAPILQILHLRVFSDFPIGAVFFRAQINNLILNPAPYNESNRKRLRLRLYPSCANQ